MKLTEEMIREIPKLDIHVHVPGTITPKTAWELGVTNGLLIKTYNKKGETIWIGQKLDPRGGFDTYRDIFKVDGWHENGEPLHVEYALEPGRFKSFDGIMAVVQGHRYPPGGMQTEADYKTVMRAYLNSCVDQKIIHTEVQQNIRLAYSLYDQPGLENVQRRMKFYQLLASVQQEFEEAGVSLKYWHCFNKTRFQGEDNVRNRAVKGAMWIAETDEKLVVGMQSAGHEGDEFGWPVHLKEAYEMVHESGRAGEAHAGEGIGSAHMMDVIEKLGVKKIEELIRLEELIERVKEIEERLKVSLHEQRRLVEDEADRLEKPVTRFAHGFQCIENQKVIERVKLLKATLVMCPEINIALGSPVHMKEGEPCPKEQGGLPVMITSLDQHPFFPLLRDHELKIALATDNPGLGGVTYTEMLLRMAGLSKESTLKDMTPLQAEELVICMLNAVDCAVCEPEVKREGIRQISEFVEKYNITNIRHHLLEKTHVQRLLSHEPVQGYTNWIG